MAKYVRYTESEWSAVYKDGVLVPETVGDHYYADEYFQRVLEVVTIDNNDFMRGGQTRDGVATTLDEIAEYNDSLITSVNLDNRVQVINGGSERWVALKNLSETDCAGLNIHPKVMETDGTVREINFSEWTHVNNVRN